MFGDVSAYERPSDAGRSAQATWWLGPARRPDARSGPRRSRHFADSGLTVMTAGDAWILADAGPFGYEGAGHSHSDTLGFVACLEGRELLIDAGTFTYVDPELRDWFRSSAAHNTVRVDGFDQARAAGPFRWLGKPRVEVEAWETGPDEDLLRATCVSPIRHTRTLILAKEARLLLIIDEISGSDSTGEHTIEQFWHAAGAEGPAQAACRRGRHRVGVRRASRLAVDGLRIEGREPDGGPEPDEPLAGDAGDGAGPRGGSSTPIRSSASKSTTAL